MKIKNGTIRVTYWRDGKNRYYYTNSFRKFLEFLKKHRYDSPNYHVRWGDTWHSCHTIDDVRRDLACIHRISEEEVDET